MAPVSNPAHDPTHTLTGHHWWDDPGWSWGFSGGTSDTTAIIGFENGAETALYAPDGGLACRGRLPSGTGRSSGSGSSGTGSSGTTAPATTGSPFVINVTWDASVASAPAAFRTAVLAAVQYLESTFDNHVTLNISVGYGEVGGTALGSGNLGSSQSYLASYSYGSLLSALTKDASSAVDQTALASLAATAPVNGTFWTTTAEAKALGLNTSTTSADGSIGFSSSNAWTYSDANGVAAGTYDFYGVALHELTEVMGRLLLTGSTIGGLANSYSLMDLFHYSAAGVRDFSASTPGYFSANGGVTSLGAFNTVSGGDAGDWASSVANDSFDAFSSSGVVNTVSASDLSVMDALGWNMGATAATPTPTSTPAPTPTPVSTSQPTGISITAATGGLNAAQTATGLAPRAALATIGQVGGAAGDSYSYALGGTNASSFTLTASGNTAALAIGSAALAGAPNGRLYSATVTATDKTSGKAAPAQAIAAVVGSGSADTVNVSSLTSALGTAAPTFVYGLAGNDTLNGTGMTGTLFFVGGAGADTMTGGSGVNDYLFGATTDSTAKSLDVITNFHVGTDAIDLTGIGSARLTYTGQIASGAKLGADSIGWQQSGGNTLVYVNATSGSAPLPAVGMEIELAGVLTPTAGSFLHA